MTADHDPLDHQLDDEPRFVLLARDPSAAELVRLWFAMRKRDRTLCDAIYKRLMSAMSSLPYQPHKDKEHVLSAQAVANSMDLWLAAEKAKMATGGTQAT